MWKRDREELQVLKDLVIKYLENVECCTVDYGIGEDARNYWRAYNNLADSVNYQGLNYDEF